MTRSHSHQQESIYEVAGAVAIVRLYRFSRLERRKDTPPLLLLAESGSSVSGTGGGGVFGMGGSGGINLMDGTRGVWEARREDLRGSGGGFV